LAGDGEPWYGGFELCFIGFFGDWVEIMQLNPKWLNAPETQKLIASFGADKIRFVGGAVRDAVLGFEAVELDAATIFEPQETITMLEKAGIRAIPTGLAHGTITAVINEKTFEITSLRRDVSCDGRHAEVAFGTDWREDAARRDFTMNAMYLSADGELFDYFDGASDARAGRVRFIGDARARIAEDYLRILRFFRFFASYGKGAPDETALAACAEFAGQINTLSGERIQHEMLKLLAADAPFSVLELMQKQGVFIHAFGFSMSSLRGAIRDVAIQKNPPSRLAFLLLNADIPALDALSKIKERWKISGALHKQLLLLINNVNEISPETLTAKQKHLIRKLGNKNFLAVIVLKNALAPHADYQKMLELANSWQAPAFPITGADLLSIGTPQGKELGEKLHALEKIWEESDYTLTRDNLLKS